MHYRLNHFVLGGRNIYESADCLFKVTGLGYTTSEWIQSRACHRCRSAATSSLKSKAQSMLMSS